MVALARAQVAAALVGSFLGTLATVGMNGLVGVVFPLDGLDADKVGRIRVFTGFVDLVSWAIVSYSCFLLLMQFLRMDSRRLGDVGD